MGKTIYGIATSKIAYGIINEFNALKEAKEKVEDYLYEEEKKDEDEQKEYYVYAYDEDVETDSNELPIKYELVATGNVWDGVL